VKKPRETGAFSFAGLFNFIRKARADVRPVFRAHRSGLRDNQLVNPAGVERVPRTTTPSPSVAEV
jgi:hypothetical protein